MKALKSLKGIKLKKFFQQHSNVKKEKYFQRGFIFQIIKRELD